MEPDSKVKPLSAASTGLRQRLEREQKGFSVLELMVVIGIVGIVATFALPAYQQWMTHSAVNNAMHTLTAKLKQARNVAVAENRNVTMTFTGTSFTYDVGTCKQCEQLVVDFTGQYPNVALTRSSAANLVFLSSGSVTGNQTFKLSRSGYTRKVIVNMIGRAYEK